MMSNVEMNAILDLDLNAIKSKLMHRESGEGWTKGQADAVEREYKRFLYLMTSSPAEPAAPSVAVDTFWHYHILDTMKYAADCEQAFGRFLHHYPYVGMEGRADDDAVHRTAAERMHAIYERAFGEPYPQDILAVAANGTPAYCSIIEPARADGTGNGKPLAINAAYCGVVVPPAATAAYCGVAPPAAKAAYCGIVVPPAAKEAYCGVAPPADKAAYCGIVVPPAAKAAYCGVVVPPATVTRPASEAQQIEPITANA